MKKKFFLLSPIKKMLYPGMLLISAETLYLRYYINSPQIDIRLLPGMAENIIAALTLLLCGMLCADILERYFDKNRDK
jgi:hypothetical protein